MNRFFTYFLLVALFALGTHAAAAAVTTNIGGGTTLPTMRGPGLVTPEPPLKHPKPHPEGRWRGPCSTWWEGENLTPSIWASHPERGRVMMQRLIVCIFGVYAPGESIMALYVADRESSLYPWAKNPSSSASGLFQHLATYWSGRAAAYLKPWQFAPWYDPSVFDPRANAICAAKMVAQSGWGPWSM